ncbi:hypothetical protein DSCO28_64150 [Desulfosarcina ovata subsp. sediminis]|uniref:Chromosome partition protein Smc n=1 Tax=Desulfosarcina ovata subsp. sediminis TaxID=885957 RepID=A0A5K7ZZZ5_9BACT|nr:hypothetical protein [Desulfosarcina ovata]BBO85849.1 hypothetical protein DSCO28_64150 [Desulfosarcina ovata subsp. sediminis]
MRKKITLIFVIAILVVSTGLLGYRLYTLSKAHAATVEELSGMSHRAELLQRKYAEQKAQAAAFQRAKLTVEGLKRQAEMKADALAEQMEAMKAEMASIEQKQNGRIAALEARLTEKDDVIAKWKASHSALTDSLRQAKQTLRQRDEKIEDMAENTRQLESELEFASRTRDRYLSENQKIAATAKSILARYDEKGVFATAIMQVEPFTQLKKVELEKLIQDYLDQIDDQTLRNGE